MCLLSSVFYAFKKTSDLLRHFANAEKKTSDLFRHFANAVII